MSYCRFGEADVYVYTSSSAIECCACSLHSYEDKSDPNATGIARMRGMMTQIPDDIKSTFGGPNANQDMIDHLRVHQARGDDVPEYVFERLSSLQDVEENQSIFAKYRSK